MEPRIKCKACGEAEDYGFMMKCEHIGTVTHSNGARQCPNCHTVWVKDVPEMRKVYGYPQFRVVWEKI